MIKMIDVSKDYCRRRFPFKTEVSRGVCNLDLEIENGAFGLLGINGAGKTTTLKMIATLLRPGSGRILIDGLDSRRYEKQLRSRINMITGSDRMLYFRLTGRENLLYFASLYGMGRREARRRSSELLELTGLSASADKRVEQYSRGMKQRLAIARGLINDPAILLLDEPTLGLDVSIAADIRKFIKDVLLSENRRTLILTSHYMSEIEELCPRVGILQEGRLIYDGGYDDLYRRMGMEEVHCFNIPARYAHLKERIEDLAAGPLSWNGEKKGELEFSMPADAGFRFLKNVDSLSLSGMSYSQRKPGLEEAVMKLTSGRSRL